jgi:hypothetical protein
MNSIHLAQDRVQWRVHEHRNEPSGTINDRKFLDCLSAYQLLKKNSASWSWLVIQIGEGYVLHHQVRGIGTV